MFKVIIYILPVIFFGCVKASEEFHFYRINKLSGTARRNKQNVENDQKRTEQVAVQMQELLEKLKNTVAQTRQVANSREQ